MPLRKNTASVNGPKEARQFHTAVEKNMVPLAERCLALKARELDLKKLRPWDTAVDAFGEKPLRPFTGSDELVGGVQSVFVKLDGELSNYLTLLYRENLLDLETRQSKRAGGFNAGLPLSKRSFIFMNAAGSHNDLLTLLHEGGHAFHNFLSYSRQPLIFNQNAAMEFCEVASMSMELLAMPYFEFFYTAEDAARARLTQLTGIAGLFCKIAQFDAFQHEIYEKPNLTPDQRHQLFLQLDQRFVPGVDWSGLEDLRRISWQRVLHVFRYPFYMIEYAIAQTGALQVWANSLKDRRRAFLQYREALTLGGTVDLPQLFQTAGASFSLNADLLKKLAVLLEEKINQELKAMGRAAL